MQVLRVTIVKIWPHWMLKAWNVTTGLDASDNGKFYDYQGNELPW